MGCPPLRAVRSVGMGVSLVTVTSEASLSETIVSDREIARRCAVDHEVVGRLRASLAENASDTPDPTERTYTDKHGKVRPLLEAEARERQLSGLRKGTKSPLATVVANGEVGLHKANDLAGATVGVRGKGAALLTVCLRAAPEMAVAPASPGPPLSLVCLWRVQGRRVDH